MRAHWPLSLLLLVFVTACGAADADPESDSYNVKVDTESELAWAQYRANIDFAAHYQPTCVVSDDGAADPTQSGDAAPRRPRVLVSGFGRFLSNPTNATGQMVSALVQELDYPETTSPTTGQVDPPAPQTAVALGTIELESGPVDVCGMVLPVYWDLAAVLVLAEIEAFRPDFVLMNGIAGATQPLWFELGAINRAKAIPDGSGVLSALPDSPLIEGAAVERANLLSWERVRSAARGAVQARAAVVDDGVPLAVVLDDALLASYPRPSNTYLCNNTTYTVGHLMDHPRETVRLLEPSHPREGYPSGIDVTLSHDFSATPRVFVHWPSALVGSHLDAGAEVMQAIIEAQLTADPEHDLPTPGDPDQGDF